MRGRHLQHFVLLLSLTIFFPSPSDGGEMVRPLRRFKRALIERHSTRWRNGVVPYEMGASFTAEQRANLTAAMATWQRETCVTFRPKRPGDRNWLRVVDGNRCHSLVGRHPDPGAQELILERQCRMFGVILHELGHALGLLHEHNRPDRDTHIHVDGARAFNRKENEAEILTYGTPYDLQSIMHYGVNEFPSGEKPNVKDQAKKGMTGYVYHKDLSFFDVRAINLHYRCNAHCEPKKNCPGSAFQNKSCECEGPEDYADRRCFNLNSDEDCNNRADRGHCDLYPIDMRHHCRKACNTCFKHAGHGVHVRQKVCKDFQTSCPGWASSGECESNPRYMDATCPMSCRKCTPTAGGESTTTTAGPTTPAPPCVNVESDRNCAFWKNRGNCQNRRFRRHMRIKCYRTCSGCAANVSTTPRPCVNTATNSDCEQWQRSGYCQEHQYLEWMRRSCYRTCGYCTGPTTTTTTTTTTVPPPGRPPCVDSDSRCASWANSGECSANPGWMRNNCKKSCNNCSTATASQAQCEDSNESCPQWARMGECQRNPGYMSSNCRRSCNTCPCRDEAVSCPINASYCRLIYHFQACRKTCQSCMVCQDKRADCPNLAATFYCRYPTAIRECPVSCGVC